MNIRIPRMATVATMALALLLSPSLSVACGESLYRVGKGVSYRTYSAPIPGNIIVFTGWSRSEEVATLLAAAGHSVRLVVDQADLGRALEEMQADVVLAPVSVSVAGRSNENAQFIPVIIGRSAEETEAAASFDRQVRADARINVYLKQIHLSLKAA